MGNFADATLGDVIELKRGYDLPQQDRVFGSVPIVSSSGITAYNSRAMARGPGVITGRYGTLGLVFYVVGDFWPLNTTLYVRDFKGNHPRFIYYFLQSLDFYAYSDKAAVPGLNRNHLHLAPVRYPVEFDDQRAIADVLGALDDKIDLNRRINETLEATATAIFKDWFVNFGPTRAKMEGRAPYLAPEIWALFPERLDDEDKPEGWTKTRIDQHAIVTKGRSYTSPELAPSRTALVTLKSFARGGGYRRDGLKAFTGKYKELQVIIDGDVVIAQTDVTQAADIIGRPARIISDNRFDTLVASLDVAILRPRPDGLLDREFLYGLTMDDAFTQHAIAHSTGTTVLHLSKDAIPNFEFPLPTGLVSAHASIAEPLNGRIAANVHESEAIAAARDVLLPKLMSGDLRVKDAEKVAEAVA